MIQKIIVFLDEKLHGRFNLGFIGFTKGLDESVSKCLCISETL
jgi:hypothetical protein